MRASTLSSYSRLRLLVGYLGEKAQDNWWPTSFFTPTSPRFLEPVFSRTVRLAQYNGVREAARRLHDERIGVGDVFHLFRLPEEVEQDLHQAMLTAPDEWFVALSSKEQAIDDLLSLAGESIDIPEGPILAGGIKQLQLPSGAKSLSQHYLAAFQRGIWSFPYFSG